MNPYFNRGAIADPKYFFGRKELLSHIFTALNAPKPQNLSIEGERRIGKSSLLNYLMHPEVRQERLDQPDRFVLVMADFLDYQPQDAAEFIRTLHYYLCLELERTCKQEDIAKEVQPFRERVKSLSTKQTNQLKENLKEHLMQLRNAGLYVVFLIDEADSVFLRAKLDYSVFDFMRSLADVPRYYSVSYIIASRRPLRDICQALVSSKFHNIFDIHRLSLLAEDEALKLMQVPSSLAGVTLSPDDERFVLGLVGCHPWALQIACYYLFEQKTRRLTDLEALTQIVYAQMKPVMTDWWEDSTDEEHQVLRATSTAPVPSSQLDLDVAARLKERGLLVERESGLDCFCKLLKRFVLEQQVIGGKKTQTEVDLSRMVSGWISQGESQTVEFKRELPENATQLAKEIAAFASGEGGVILVGVEDDGRVCGIRTNSPQERERFRQRVYGIAANVLKPPTSIDVDFLRMRGKTLAVIQVPPGQAPLYYVEDRPYLRHGSIVRSPTPDEMADRYSISVRPAASAPASSSLASQERTDGLRAEVWRLIESVELALRRLIARTLEEKAGPDWEQFLAKRHPELYENWLAIQDKHHQSFRNHNQSGGHKETALDYSFIADLGGLMAADWEFYRDALDFGRSSSKENKRHWVEILEAIVKVRNALAHHRLVPENELKRTEVFCNDILIVLNASRRSQDS